MVRPWMLGAVLLVALWAAFPGGVGRPGPARAETLFARMDADGDGVVSPDEFRAAWPEAPVGSFEQLDADGDGRLTHAEWADGRAFFGLGQGGTCGGGGSGCGSGRGLGRRVGQGAGVGQ